MRTDSVTAVVTVWLFCVLVPVTVAGQNVNAGAIVIDGPPAPAAPAVITRDDQGRATVRAVRLSEPLVIDGQLSEPVYETVPALDGFIQQEPREGEPVTEKTEAWVFFDQRNIYISVRCWDSQPSRMVMNEMRRDNPAIFQNESVTVVLDTFYDRRNGFFFQTNPLGALRDGLVTDERNNNNDWNTVWDTRSAFFDQGWTVEMVIPFKSLRYREGVEQIWGINIRRGVRWKNEQQFLTRIPASYTFRGIYKFSSAATLVGIEAPGARRALEVKPYAISAVRTDRQASPAFANELEGDAGVDVKYGLTRGLIADFTVNTDFAQVEDDDQQVNLTRFSLFFPEKRDFFLEGQGIFAFGGAGAGRGGGMELFGAPTLTPILFFSRRIGLSGSESVPIRAGGRVTGRAGAYTVGALNIQTGESDSASVHSTNFTVLRVRRDILRRSAIGAIVTNRSPTAGPQVATQTAGLDAYLAFQENFDINAYYARTRRPGETRDQASYRGFANYVGDRWGLGYEHLYVGEGFVPDVGFLRRDDFRRNYGQLRFSPRPGNPASPIRKFNYELSLDHITDGRGTLETREVAASIRTEMQNSDQWTIDYTRTYEFLEEPFAIATGVTLPVGGYQFQEVAGVYMLGQQRKVSGRVTVGGGSFYSGHRTEAGYMGRIDLGSRLLLEPRLSINWVDLAEGSFTTKLVSARTNFTLTPRMQSSALVQYNSSNNTLSANIRFRWEYRPGSDLYVVYTEGRDTDRPGGPDLQARGFVVKLTRLLRF